ncbi:MAG: CSLREA domain-containing protein [Candidatus Binatus sp.]
MANRNRRYALAAVALTFLFVAIPASARAATITVNSTMDDTNAGHCTLREAITSANGTSSGIGNCTTGTGTDTIEFTVTGTITLGSTLPSIANTLTITGPTGSSGITISGGGLVQLMQVSTGVTLNLQSLTLTDGNETGSGGDFASSGLGGAIFNNGTLTVTNSIFSGNQAAGGTGTEFSGSGEGGAIFNNSGTVTVTNSTFSSNTVFGGFGTFFGNSPRRRHL